MNKRSALPIILPVIICLVEFFALLFLMADRIAKLRKTSQELQLQIEQIQQEKAVQESHIDELSRQIRELQKSSLQWEMVGRGGERKAQQITYLGEYTVTGYCSCEKCCGRWAKNRPGGKVYGAAGVELTPGVSVAGWLPLGSRIMIDGREYIVQDRTAKWVRDKYDSKIIDIYCADHETAWNIGNEKHDVWLIEGRPDNA